MVSKNPNYCPMCGTELIDEQIEGRSRRYCTQCETPIYQNPKPCAGVLVVDKRERILLVKRAHPPAPGSWSVPAGYLEVDEPPQEAAIRELSEETGLRVNTDALELLDTAFVRHPDGQHVLVIIYTASRSETNGTVAPGSDAADARFWTLTELETHDEEIEPGYDSILEQAVSEVKDR